LKHISIFVISVALFVIRVGLLSIVMFCVLLMCKCVLPPGVNPTAVDKYININMVNVLTKLKEFFLYHGAAAPSGSMPPHCRGFINTLRHTTLGRTPLDE
jgi:hypothetical protein